MTIRILPLILIVIGIGYVWLALGIPLDPWSAEETVNSRTLPVVYGTLLAVLALPLLIRGNPLRIEGIEPARWYRLTALCAVTVLFALAVRWVGLWAAVAALLAVSLLIMGERRPSVLILGPAATACAGWAIIELGLGVYLERGALFD